MPKTLRAIQASAGIRAEYQRHLVDLLKSMHKSVIYWMRAAYRRNEAEILAQDALPSKDLQSAFKKSLRQWNRNYKKRSQKIAEWFAGSSRRRVDFALKDALDAVGFTVEFKLTRAEQDTLRSIIIENTDLINSIESRYMEGVQGAIQRAVQAGGDLAGLTDELENLFGVTRRRAEFIARDQTQKATQALQRTRDKDLGITQGIWVHVPGRKMSRKTHMEMNGETFVLAEGLEDPDVDRKVKPGELPGCMCTYRAIIPIPGEQMEEGQQLVLGGQ